MTPAPRIFIAEDEALVALELEDRLREFGYEVCGRAARGEAALQRIPELCPDLVILDVNLGKGMTGIDVAERLRGVLDAPILFLTAYSDAELASRAVRTESFACLVKPFQPQALRANIEMALYKHGAEKKLREANRKLDETAEMLRAQATELLRSQAVLEAALSVTRQSEARFRALFEQAAVGVAEVETGTGRFLRVNRKFAEIVGYSEEELLAFDVAQITHPDDHAAGSSSMLRLRAGEVREFSKEKRYIRKDGTVVWVHLTLSATQEAGQAPARHIAVVQDITERKLVESSLRILSTGMVHLTGDDFFAEIARHLVELLAVDASYVGLLVGPTHERVRIVGLSTDGRRTAALEFPLAGSPCELTVAKNGTLFLGGVRDGFPGSPLLEALHASALAAVPVVDARGHAIGTLGVVSRSSFARPDQVMATLRLFAVRTGAEMERRREEARFQDLFEFSPDAVLMVDDEGAIVLANRRAVSLFGYHREELLGLSVDLLVPEAQRGAHARQRARFLADPAVRLMGAKGAPLKARRKDGSVFPADIGLSPLRSEDGPLFVVAVRDVTERVKAEQQRQSLELQLRHAQKMDAMGTLAGGIAHDFNNLLTAIVANVELARAALDPSHSAVESLDEVSGAAARAAGLVRQILAFSRRQPPKRARTALAEIVLEAARLLRSAIPSGIALETTLTPDVPDVLADPTQIHQVIMNLGTNAWHAIERGTGRIEIHLESKRIGPPPEGRVHLPPGVYAQLRIRDDGRGMDARILERIFEPFFTTKEVGRGTGLGLSVVHGIVHDHGGAVIVDSEPGSGTEVTVFLPAMPSGAPEPRPARAEPSAHGGQGRVLYLDDEEALVGTAIRLLRHLGYEPEGFTRPGDALTAVRRDPSHYDVVVTDFHMPGLSGLEVAAEIARLRPDLPIVLVSGHAERTDEQLAAAGVRFCVDKPFGLQDFADVLRLARRRP